MKIEISVSFITLETTFGVKTDVFGVEDQVDCLIFHAMQDEFAECDVNATSGASDSIEIWNEDGDPINPETINAPIRVTNALNKIDWNQIQYDLEAEM